MTCQLCAKETTYICPECGQEHSVPQGLQPAIELWTEEMADVAMIEEARAAGREAMPLEAETSDDDAQGGSQTRLEMLEAKYEAAISACRAAEPIVYWAARQTPKPDKTLLGHCFAEFALLDDNGGRTLLDLIAELETRLAAAIQERDAAIEQWYAARAVLLHTQTERDDALEEAGRLREERAG